jgi:hypothetical protein
LTNAKISKVRDFENSDLSEREKMALRYTDYLKFNPQGVDERFLEELQRHFTDGEICEIGYIVMAYGGAHNFLSSIKERVYDDEGNDISDADGFPIVFHTMEARSEMQAEEEAAIDGPLPEHAQR